MSRGGRSLTLLVLGVGGNVSQGILKALAHGSLPRRVLAGCISPLSLGLYLADRSFVTPRADDPEFLPWLERVCSEEGVDAVLSGAEPVLEALAPQADRIRERTGAFCVVSPPEVLEIGQDKLTTALWLSAQGMRSPRSADAADADAVRGLAEECGFPVLAKPRRGKGGAGISILHDARELETVIGSDGLVVQEHLAGDDAEYTVGCVCDAGGVPRSSLTLRRELQAGTTYRAETGHFPDVTAYAERIAAALGPVGPLNVQIRVAGGQPVAFELNVRFSGTTPVRTRLGFDEVDATLRHLVLGEPLRVGAAREGTVLRYWNEVYVSASAREELDRSGHLEDPSAHATTVEDWGMRP